MNKTDQQLLEEVRRGRDRAWKSLVARYEKLVMSVAMRCGLSRADAEDCAQLSWIALYRNLDYIRDPARLGAWLAITTRRNATRMAKRLSIKSEYLEGDEATEPELFSDQEAVGLERRAQLDYAINQLDDRCRRIIREVFYSPKGDSYREISDRLGLSENSIGPIRYRCLEKLRRILKECGFL